MLRCGKQAFCTLLLCSSIGLPTQPFTSSFSFSLTTFNPPLIRASQLNSIGHERDHASYDQRWLVSRDLWYFGPLPFLLDGGLTRLTDMWPGQAMTLKVNQILHHEKSKYQDVLVFESSHHGTVLVLDNVIQCTERDEFSYVGPCVAMRAEAALDASASGQCSSD